jgi:hypothetical protein
LNFVSALGRWQPKVESNIWHSMRWTIDRVGGKQTFAKRHTNGSNCAVIASIQS